MMTCDIVLLMRLLGFVLPACVLLGSTAWASVDLQGQLSTSGGYNSNVTNAPTNANLSTDPNAPRVEADEFFDVRPSLVLTAGTPRALNRLAYAFSANLFLEHSNANSYSHALDWAGFFLLSPTTDLLVTANGSYAQTNTLTTLNPPDGQTLQVTPQGETKF